MSTTTPFDSFQKFPAGAPPQNPPPGRLLFPVDDSTSVILQPADVTPRPRGRPKTKVQPADVRSGPTTQGVPGPPPPRAPSTPSAVSTAKTQEDELRRKAEAKAKDVKVLQGKIVSEFNEELLQGLIALGIPAPFLYKSGHSNSAQFVINSNYTDIAQGICINPMQASWIAHGIVEAKQFPFLQKLTTSSDPNAPSYLWLALGGLGLLSYVTNLVQTVKTLQSMVNELKRIQNGQINPEDMRDPTVMNFQETPANPFGE